MHKLSAVFLILCVVVSDACFASTMGTKRKKLVIDNDAGGDDAVAIFLAAFYETFFDGPELVGLTTANGNTIEKNVYYNNQRILSVVRRQDVPIYRGSKESILVTPEETNYFGVDGLGDVNETFTDLVPARDQHAVLALIDLANKHKDDLNIITIGTLTNVALALKLDPYFLDKVGHLYVGAGHIHDEHTPDPEFNALMDVEAYKIVMEKANPEKVTLLPFSQVMSSLDIDKAWRLNVLGNIDSNVVRAMNKYEKLGLDQIETWQSLDPAIVAVALNPGLVEEYKYSNNSIITCGDKRGMNTNSFVDKNAANVKIVYSVKIEEYKQFLLNVFSA